MLFLVATIYFASVLVIVVQVAQTIPNYTIFYKLPLLFVGIKLYREPSASSSNNLNNLL